MLCNWKFTWLYLRLWMNYLVENNQSCAWLTVTLFIWSSGKKHSLVFFLWKQGRESEFVHANLFTYENKNINNILVLVNIFQNEQDHYAFSNEIQVTIVLQLCKMLLLSKGWWVKFTWDSMVIFAISRVYNYFKI